MRKDFERLAADRRVTFWRALSIGFFAVTAFATAAGWRAAGSMLANPALAATLDAVAAGWAVAAGIMTVFCAVNWVVASRARRRL